MENHQSNLIDDILKAFNKYAPNKAFVIEDIAYTYGQLSTTVLRIITQIKNRKEKIIGVVGENNLETYSSILAILICGKTYVILHPAYPKQRNWEIAKKANIHFVLHTGKLYKLIPENQDKEPVYTDMQQKVSKMPDVCICETVTAYILFTSGSTGEPKGVPISHKNLNAFYNAYKRLGWVLNENDRMLQMFELTFDVSIVSYLYPLTLGASIYTVSTEGIKYINIIDLMERHNLTFAAVAPSLLQLLRPYFSEIQLPLLKYLIVTAEASDVELLSAFRRCAPNAELVNLYGPTEGTIYCTAYPIPQTSCKHHNGMAAIGKPFNGIDVLIIDEHGHPLSSGEIGELWISGKQVMDGYWSSPDKSTECLVDFSNGKRYYKTGDLCFIDTDGDIIYCGRKDSQIKLHGFRIELSEIEYVANSFFDGKHRVVVVPKYSEDHQCELHLVIEATQIDQPALEKYLKGKLPFYMIPKQIHHLQHFPLNNSSKTDRKKIQELI